MIDGHGDDAWKYKDKIRADFSSNVWYGELNAGLRTHLQSVIGMVTHYPEAGAQSLQAAAATAFGVLPGEVLVTNGATEAIYLVAQAFRGMKATVMAPAFAEYEDACRLQGMEVRFMEWERLRDGSLRLGEGLVFLCNPNNPTGAALPSLQLRKLFEGNRDILFVIDESYIEFTRATESVPMEYFSNVLVLRSLTKSCRIPGLRIGFLIGPEELIRKVRAYKMPWSVNRLAIEAGLYIFRHREEFVLPVERLLADTDGWRRELRAATGWWVWDTDTHYFLFEGLAGLKEWLIRRHGLLVRDASNFRGLGAGLFRVACQSPEQNKFLTEALRECSRNGL